MKVLMKIRILSTPLWIIAFYLPDGDSSFWFRESDLSCSHFIFGVHWVFHNIAYWDSKLVVPFVSFAEHVLTGLRDVWMVT